MFRKYGRRKRVKSKFKAYCRKRAKLLGRNIRRGSPFDPDNRPSQCARCDRGMHRRCERLPHCRARFRSPNGVRRRELNRAAARARRAAAARSAAQEAEAEENETEVYGDDDGPDEPPMPPPPPPPPPPPAAPMIAVA